MDELVRDAAALLSFIADKEEQDPAALAVSLKGDLMDAYRRVIQLELDQLRDAERKLLQSLQS